MTDGTGNLAHVRNLQANLLALAQCQVSRDPGAGAREIVEVTGLPNVVGFQLAVGVDGIHATGSRSNAVQRISLLP